MELDRAHFIAVDWSGALTGERKKIWIAEAVGGRLLRLEDGFSRVEICDYLVERAQRDPPIVVGLDFAFSFPAGYLQEGGIQSGPALWAAAYQDGETWLRQCEPPFWGRPGKRNPRLAHEFRASEKTLVGKHRGRPKSVFQIGGAGAVGTGTVRGLPFLLRLQSAGLAIWPFDDPRLPMVIEIYPRLLTGPLVKSSRSGRAQIPARLRAGLTTEQFERVCASEDALDAALSALEMDRNRASFASLPMPSVSERLEGMIWDPQSMATARSGSSRD
jgi:hypothetical protein